MTIFTSLCLVSLCPYTQHSTHYTMLLNICTSLLFADPEPCTLPESLSIEQSISECDCAVSSPLREAEDGERRVWPVAWHDGMLAFFTPTPAPARLQPSSSTAQSGESETLLLGCSARQDPGSHQPDFYFFMLASAQPSPGTAKLPTVSLHPAGGGAGPGQDCHTNVLYHHYLCSQPATEPWASTPTFILTLIHYFLKIPFASLLYDSVNHQSNILYHCTGRYLDI